MAVNWLPKNSVDKKPHHMKTKLSQSNFLYRSKRIKFRLTTNRFFGRCRAKKSQNNRPWSMPHIFSIIIRFLTKGDVMCRELHVIVMVLIIKGAKKIPSQMLRVNWTIRSKVLFTKRASTCLDVFAAVKRMKRKNTRLMYFRKMRGLWEFLDRALNYDIN